MPPCKIMPPLHPQLPVASCIHELMTNALECIGQMFWGHEVCTHAGASSRHGSHISSACYILTCCEPNLLIQEHFHCSDYSYL